jgi:hypothetical protein
MKSTIRHAVIQQLPDDLINESQLPPNNKVIQEHVGDKGVDFIFIFK